MKCIYDPKVLELPVATALSYPVATALSYTLNLTFTIPMHSTHGFKSRHNRELQLFHKKLETGIGVGLKSIYIEKEEGRERVGEKRNERRGKEGKKTIETLDQ